MKTRLGHPRAHEAYGTTFSSTNALKLCKRKVHAKDGGTISIVGDSGMPAGTLPVAVGRFAGGKGTPAYVPRHPRSRLI
jgi:hypothetical protein